MSSMPSVGLDSCKTVAIGPLSWLHRHKSVVIAPPIPSNKHDSSLTALAAALGILSDHGPRREQKTGLQAGDVRYGSESRPSRVIARRSYAYVSSASSDSNPIS